MHPLASTQGWTVQINHVSRTNNTSVWEASATWHRCIAPLGSGGFIYLAFPGFDRATPHKALVYDPQILLPVVHFEPVHMGAPCRTHGRKHIRGPLYFSDEISSTAVTRRIIHQLFRFARQCCEPRQGRRCVPYTCGARFSTPPLHENVIPGENLARELVVKLNTLWYCIFQVGCFNGRQWNSTEHRGRRNPCEVKRRLADGLRFVAAIGQHPCHFR